MNVNYARKKSADTKLKRMLDMLEESRPILLQFSIEFSRVFMAPPSGAQQSLDALILLSASF